MKCSESWLREWTDPEEGREALGHLLTMAGLEVESLSEENDVIDISITPNRGDCLSVRGIAREVAALTNTQMKAPSIPCVNPSLQDSLAITLNPKQTGCGRYVGRIIRGVKADLATPAWLSRRLQESGIRSISPIVDVTNYVMLELGQPMHAFDLNTISHHLQVRLSEAGEKITLLDASEKELDAETLVIADEAKPLAIAGVMGGLDSSVTLLTKDIFLESAYFDPKTIARQRQYYGLNSDSAYRFERGVDPTIQREAIERATQLILDIVGGKAGPVIEVTENQFLPKSTTIMLSKKQVDEVLGFVIDSQQIIDIFTRLGFEIDYSQQLFEKNNPSWRIEIPPYRFDLSLPEDLIEEIVRIYGYDHIPFQPIHATIQTNNLQDSVKDLTTMRQILCDQGYSEIIAYSFIDPSLQALFDPEVTPHALLNPITADMAVMRTNLWPGLVNALIYNQSRQQNRIRLFEFGSCFLGDKEEPHLGGLIAGDVEKTQWGISSRPVDFYDIKGDLQSLLKQVSWQQALYFKKEAHPALHPGQSAAIYCAEEKLGIVGALHPQLAEHLSLSSPVFLFELRLNVIQQQSGTKQFHEISKFPEVRRDIAILLDLTIPAKKIQDTIRNVAGDWLTEVFIFDVYQGKGIAPGQKSVALGLIWQHPTRTLVEEEIAASMELVINELKGHLKAELRSRS